MDMSWSYVLVRTRDGARIADLEPVSHGSWARRLDIKSTGSQTFTVGGGLNTLLWSATRPSRRTLVVCWNSIPVYAGVIKNATYDARARTVSVNHEDIWAIWELRQASPRYMAWDNPDRLVKETQIRYADRSRRTLAKRIVQLGLRGIDPDAPAYDLPIIFPADETGNWTRTFRTAEWLTVADRLHDLTTRGGPMQVDFAPVWTSAGAFAWEMRVSHDLQYPTTVLHADVPQSPVKSLTVTNDVSDYASEFHVTGSGQGVDALHRYWSSSYLSSDQVALARVWADGTIEDGEDLEEYRDGLLERHTNVTVQIDCTVAIGSSGGPSPTDLRLGQSVMVRTSDDPVLPAGDAETMLIGFSPDGPGALKLELSPTDGFTGHSVADPSLHYRNLNASRVHDTTDRIHRAEHRLVYPAGGATAAATSTQEGI